jgi:hypothetical protein
MKIRVIRSYRWGNYRTCIVWGKPDPGCWELIVGILGLMIFIMSDRYYWKYSIIDLFDKTKKDGNDS